MRLSAWVKSGISIHGWSWVVYTASSCATSLFLPRVDVLRDLLLNRPKPTWNLFVLYNDQKRKKPDTHTCLPCEQKLHFRGMSWRAKSSLSYFSHASSSGWYRENVASARRVIPASYLLTVRRCVLVYFTLYFVSASSFFLFLTCIQFLRKVFQRLFCSKQNNGETFVKQRVSLLAMTHDVKISCSLGIFKL